ncbi:MAG: hypothetical protein LBR74_08195 [Eubacterium sp.]|jgi:hypothetical protein|nr:hypothetical protein [Eubacterium sp.]
MKRLLFVFLIVLVIGVVGAYAFFEFSVPNIVFTGDEEILSTAGNELAVRRLYTADVNLEEALVSYEEEGIADTGFTEDEYITALQQAGTPEFSPAFYFNVVRPDPTLDVYNFAALVRQEMAEEQVDSDFKIENLTLDVVAEGFMMSEVDFTYPDSNLTGAFSILSEDGTILNAKLENTPSVSMKLIGEQGMLTLNCKYDVVTNNIFPRVALEDQLLMIYINVSYQNGALNIEYIREPYSSLADMEY